MSSSTVLLAYSSSEDRNIMLDFLKTFEYSVIATTNSGFECVSLVKKYNPDIVMTDMYIYDFDASRLFELLSDAGYLKTTVFSVYARAAQNRLKTKLITLGTDVFTLIPFEYSSFDLSLREAMSEKRTAASCTDSEELACCQARDCVSKMLNDMDIPASLNGHGYIIDAVLTALHDKNALSAITTVIYPEIAKNNGTAVRNVERSIRTAIDRSYSYDGGKSMRRIIGFIPKSDEKPSNSELISLLTERARGSILNHERMD